MLDVLCLYYCGGLWVSVTVKYKDILYCCKGSRISKPLNYVPSQQASPQCLEHLYSLLLLGFLNLYDF